MRYTPTNTDAMNQERAKDQMAEDTRARNDANNMIYTLRAGRTMLRVLPPFGEDGVWFREMNEYYFRLGDTHLFLTSPRDFDQVDPLWDWGASVYEKGNDAAIAEAKKFRPKTRYLMNVLVLSDPEKGVITNGIRILKAPTSVKRALVDIDTDIEYGDITNPEAGFNILIDRTGDGLNTKYTVKAQRAQTSIFALLTEAGMNPASLNLFNLDDVHRSGVRSQEELQGILEQLQGSIKPKQQAPTQSFGTAPLTEPSTPVTVASPVPSPTPQTAQQPQPVPTGAVSSPVMQAPEGQTLPEGVVVSQPPTQGGE